MKHKRQKIVIRRKNGFITAKGNVEFKADGDFLNLVAMKVRIGEIEPTAGMKLRRFIKRLFRKIDSKLQEFDGKYSGAVAASSNREIFIPDFLLIGEENDRNNPGN